MAVRSASLTDGPGLRGHVALSAGRSPSAGGREVNVWLAQAARGTCGSVSPPKCRAPGPRLRGPSCPRGGPVSQLGAAERPPEHAWEGRGDPETPGPASAGSSEGRGVQCQAPGRRGSVVARSHAGRGLQRAHRQPHTTRHPGPGGSRPAPPLRAWGSFRNPMGTVPGRAAPLPLTPGRDGHTWCPRTLRPPRTQSNPPCCSGKSQMQTSLSLQTAGWYRHRREV